MSINKFLKMTNFLLLLISTILLFACPNNENSSSDGNNGYRVTFKNIPDGFTLAVYKSSDVSNADNTQTAVDTNTYNALQSDESVAKKDGTDQLNFILTPPQDSADKVISLNIEGTYNKCKVNPDNLETAEAKNIYRITKIESDLSISITIADKPIEVTFNFIDKNGNTLSDEKAAITVYDSQDLTGNSTPINASNASKVVTAKTDSGVESVTGSEQVNFKIDNTAPDGYKFESVSIDDTYNGKYKNLKIGYD